jgi:hypothetical protein
MNEQKSGKKASRTSLVQMIFGCSSASNLAQDEDRSKKPKHKKKEEAKKAAEEEFRQRLRDAQAEKKERDDMIEDLKRQLQVSVDHAKIAEHARIEAEKARDIASGSEKEKRDLLEAMKKANAELEKYKQETQMIMHELEKRMRERSEEEAKQKKELEKLNAQIIKDEMEKQKKLHQEEKAKRKAEKEARKLREAEEAKRNKVDKATDYDLDFISISADESNNQAKPAKPHNPTKISFDYKKGTSKYHEDFCLDFDENNKYERTLRNRVMPNIHFNVQRSVNSDPLSKDVECHVSVYRTEAKSNADGSNVFRTENFLGKQILVLKKGEKEKSELILNNSICAIKAAVSIKK